jgi:DNA-binding beta-propeller fold protein YncE
LCPSATWNPDAITLASDNIEISDATGIFVNSNNTIFVTDAENNKVLILLNDSVKPTSILSEDSWELNSIFVATNGDIYVDIYVDDDYENYEVVKWTSNTKTFISVMPVDSFCYGLFVDINNTLYCSMYENHQVVKKWLCNNTTTVTPAAGTGNEGSGLKALQNPCGIFVDINFDLYVADFGNDRIQLFRLGELNGTTVAGLKSSTTTITLMGPTGVVLDADKYLFIVEYGNSRIVGSGPLGFRCIVGCSDSESSESNELSEPWSLSFDSHGNIFVTDWESSEIQKFLLLTNSCSKYESALLYNIKINWIIVKYALFFSRLFLEL